jgi:hypothetical protein
MVSSEDNAEENTRQNIVTRQGMCRVARLFVNILCQPSCKLWVGLKFRSNSILVCHLDYNCSSIILSLELASSSPPTIYSDGWIGACDRRLKFFENVVKVTN